ncbi:hypothetical protein LLB_2227 [Legionella longbeachae D-4968]|nr:hypothetical protein LLB_2227 [Legionella longbeachae D-4968]
MHILQGFILAQVYLSIIKKILGKISFIFKFFTDYHMILL